MMIAKIEGLFRVLSTLLFGDYLPIAQTVKGKDLITDPFHYHEIN